MNVSAGAALDHCLIEKNIVELRLHFTGKTPLVPSLVGQRWESFSRNDPKMPKKKIYARNVKPFSFVVASQRNKKKRAPG